MCAINTNKIEKRTRAKFEKTSGPDKKNKTNFTDKKN